MNPRIVIALVIAGLIVLLLRSIARQRELFRIRVRHGRIEHRSGRVPPALFNDIRDVAAHPAIRSAELVALPDQGRARLVVTGDVSDAQAQRLRNVVGRFQLAQIRAGRKPRAVSDS